MIVTEQEKAKRQKLDAERPDLGFGDRVIVAEPGIESWYGTVLGLKPSIDSGWWLTVDRDGGEGAWIVALRATQVERVAQQG